MAKVEKYRKLPIGFSSLLNKMLRAVLVSRPLEAIRFLASYLEAEVNRRTLCDLQLRQPCPTVSPVNPTDPWVQYMSFVTIQRAIESLLSEEQGPTIERISSVHLKVDVNESRGGRSSGRHRVSRRLPWPPVAKASTTMGARCRLRIDRYGPIVKDLRITRRAISRYVRTDEEEPLVEDKCQRRRPIANYWRQILRDCSVMSDGWNRKSSSDQPRRRRRSSPDMPSSGEEDGEGGGEGGSDSSIDPYLEPKRRRKARNDEGLAKIIYRELGVQRPVKAAAAKDEEDVGGGKANKSVQVQLVPSGLPRPSPLPSSSEEVLPLTEVFDKAVQVDEDDISPEDRASVYPDPDSKAAELDFTKTCPPTLALSIDWTPFIRPTTDPWPDSDINWMTMEDDEDAPAIQCSTSAPDDPLPPEVTHLVDLDVPAASTVADAPAVALLLGERDDPAIGTVEDAPADPPGQLDDGDFPAGPTPADLPAEEMMAAKESEAQIMNMDEVDDPFAED